MSDQRNLILAVVLSIGIILIFQLFYEMPRIREEQSRLEQTAVEQSERTLPLPSSEDGTVAIPGTTSAEPAQNREQALSDGDRVRIDNGRLHGSLSLKGGRIDDLTLADYRLTVDPTSPEIELLNPVGSPDPYFVEYGWVASNNDVALPNNETIWQAQSSTVLDASAPLQLNWNNGEGLEFKKLVSLDDDYLFTIERSVTNNSDAPVTLYPYSLISRWGTPDIIGFYILHEGPIGVLQETLTEVDYSDLLDDGDIKQTTDNGWIGITDKYWLAALLPPQGEPLEANFRVNQSSGEPRYQVDFLGQGRILEPGQTISVTDHMFAGAKEIALLDKYQEKLNLPLFDRAVDFGWFWFLTKPFLHGLNFFYSILGNYGLAILMLTLVVKLLFFPLANKSYKSMTAMKKLQPEMQKLRERYENDKQKMQQELMALYQKEKVNPLSGCLPILLQIPVFFALYKVLFVAIELRHEPFFGWIQDLSAPDPTSMFNLFGLIPFDPPAFLMIGVWPLLMGLTMFLQQKLNPQPPDPIQAKIMAFLPVMFIFLFATFSAGLVIYWTWNNVLSIAQQWVIMRKMGVHADGSVDKPQGKKTT